MFQFDSEDRNRIERLAELIGVEVRISDRSNTDTPAFIVELSGAADWRTALEEDNPDESVDRLVDYEIRREGEFLSLLSINGYEFHVTPRFETPTRIRIEDFDTAHEAEYRDLYVPAEFETRYEEHAVEGIAPSELDAGAVITDPETDETVTVLDVHQADSRTYVVAVGTIPDGDFIGMREFTNTDTVPQPASTE